MSRVNSNFGTSVGVIIVVAVLVIVINNVVGSALKGPSTADMSDEATVERIKPVAQLNTDAPIVPEAPAGAATAAAAAPTAARSGKAVYDSACFVCHASGAAGAPKLGDAGAWAPRIEKGIDGLLTSAINGLNAMPPRGTCGNCSDDELKSAIEYMVNNSK